MRARIVIGLFLAAAVVATTAAVGALGSRGRVDAVVLRVNDREITEAQVDAYTLALTDQHGNVRLTREYVLLALINQALAMEEADRLNIRVSETQLDTMVQRAASQGFLADIASTSGGVEAYRRNLLTKLRFDMVKATVTKGVRASEAEVQAYYSLHRSDYAVGFEAARHEIEASLTLRETTAQWRAWLATRRACARIIVSELAGQLPAETWEGACRSWLPNE